jgi:hypothetical protein
MFKLLFTDQAYNDLQKLKQDKGLVKRLKSVYKALAYLEANPKHPSLNTHKYQSITGINNEAIFEAYAENNTPAAYRIFWHYGPAKDNITIVAITSHP